MVFTAGWALQANTQTQGRPEGHMKAQLSAKQQKKQPQRIGQRIEERQRRAIRFSRFKANVFPRASKAHWWAASCMLIPPWPEEYLQPWESGACKRSIGNNTERLGMRGLWTAIIRNGHEHHLKLWYLRERVQIWGPPSWWCWPVTLLT